jgi:hypothetical protein
MRELTLFVLLATPLLAQLAPPRIGFVSDLGGQFRPVLGVSGSFLLGDPVALSVVSAGYAGTFSFVKTDTTLSILGRDAATDFPAPRGRALFSFSGATGFAYYLASGTLERWDGASLTAVTLDAFEGDVLGLAQPDTNHLWLAVRQSNQQVYVLLFDGITGALQSSAPLTRATGNLALLNGQEFVFANERGLVLHRASGIEIAMRAGSIGPLADLHFEVFAANWLSVKGKGGLHFAIRTDPGRECLYRLPQNTQPENRQ